VRNDPAYPVGAAGTVLRVLLLLNERGELRVSEAAAALGIARSTAHRMLAMLIFHGLAEQDRGRVYRPGPALRHISGPAGPPPDLVTVAHPVLRRLAATAGETAHLMVLEGNGVRFVDGVEGPQTLRVGPRTGMLLPAHATSGGKALLAQLPPDQLAALYPHGLPRSDTAALTDYAQLGRELAATRRRGYGSNSEESERVVRAVGAVVRDPAGRAVAAIAVAAPSSRCPRGRLRDLAPHVIEAAHAVSAAQ
jgi:DNA-binding IclR family transcriptional regulator